MFRARETGKLAERPDEKLLLLRMQKEVEGLQRKFQEVSHLEIYKISPKSRIF